MKALRMVDMMVEEMVAWTADLMVVLKVDLTADLRAALLV